jgi:hypothetical protein
MVTTSEYINREAPDIEARKLGLIDSAKALAEQQLTLPQYQLAGFTPAQQDAFLKAQQGIGGYAPWLNLAGQGIAQGQATTQAAQNLLGGVTGAPTQAQLDPYLNPFQQQVIDQTMQELDRRGATAQQDLAGQAQQAGAFGGSRFGVQGAELGRGLQDARAQALTQLNQQNYGQAMQGFQNQMERERLAGLGIGALGQQYGGFGQQMAGLGQQYAGLGAQEQAMAGQDIQSLLGIGGMQRQREQQIFDMQRQNALQTMYEPYQRLGFYGDILAQAPTSQQVIPTATSPSVSPWQQAIGTGVGALAGIAGARRMGVI